MSWISGQIHKRIPWLKSDANHDNNKEDEFSYTFLSEWKIDINNSICGLYKEHSVDTVLHYTIKYDNRDTNCEHISRFYFYYK